MQNRANNTEVQAEQLNNNISPYTKVLKDYFPSREAILLEAQALTQKNQARKRLLKNAALGSVLSLFLLTWIIDPIIKSDYLNTQIGQQISYTLTDGSNVTLNTNSIVKSEIRLRSRRLELVQGEALLNVTHEWRSFTVQANNAYIRDIGTVFNVRNTYDGAIVTVLDGAVEVTTHDKTYLLTKNQSLTTSINQLNPSIVEDANTTMAWQQGKLLFDGTPLTTVVSEIQRYRKAPITLNDAKVGKLRISGAYDIKGIESLIDTLPISVAVKVTRQTDGSVIISNRK
ncbi:MULTISPECIES: FecR family protein [Methylotenera]|uniref:FecR family protein n=1 Tax=Methylotenera TaxID=359407 RepID=UPI00035C61C4|nr:MULTISPECIES: FecR domain-containing protein [Methylotenera]